MAESTEGGTPAASSYTVVKVYGDDDESYNNLAMLADLKVIVDDNVFHLHSSQLAGQSKVLASMFASTPKEEWAAGVAAAVQSYQLEEIRVYFALCYNISMLDGWEKSKTNVDKIKVVIELGHQLDALAIKKACETFIMSAMKQVSDSSSKVSWLGFASAHDLPRLRKDLSVDVAHKMLSSKSTQTSLTNEATVIQSLTKEDYMLLLKGALGAWNDLHGRIDTPLCLVHSENDYNHLINTMTNHLRPILTANGWTRRQVSDVFNYARSEGKAIRQRSFCQVSLQDQVEAVKKRENIEKYIDM